MKYMVVWSVPVGEEHVCWLRENEKRRRTKNVCGRPRDKRDIWKWVVGSKWVGRVTCVAFQKFRVRLVHVFKNWKLLFENICGNTCGWKSALKCVKCCLKTENSCLKSQTKHPLNDYSMVLVSRSLHYCHWTSKSMSWWFDKSSSLRLEMAILWGVGRVIGFLRGTRWRYFTIPNLAVL